MTSLCFADGVKEGIQQARVALDWNLRGYSCEMWVDPPDQTWENCRHAEDELIMVVTGLLEIEIAGTVRRLRSGQEIRIPAGAVHSVRNIGHTSACWLYGYRRL